MPAVAGTETTPRSTLATSASLIGASLPAKSTEPVTNWLRPAPLPMAS